MIGIAQLAGWKGYALTAALASAVSGALGFGSAWKLQSLRIEAMKGRVAVAQVKAAARVVEAVTRQGQVTTKVSAAAAREVARVETRTRVILREVPTYVTPETDARFALPWGFVRLHDIAARGVDLPAVPEPAGQPHDAASDVEPSEAIAGIVSNYGVCHAEIARLTGLQDWVRAQAALAREGKE